MITILLIGLALRILWTLVWLFLIPFPSDKLPEEWTAASSGVEDLPYIMMALLPELSFIGYIQYKVGRYFYPKSQQK